MKQTYYIITALSLLVAIIFNSLGLSLNHNYALASLCCTVSVFGYSAYMLCFRKWHLSKIANKELRDSLRYINKKTLIELSFNISLVVLLFVCNICVGDIAIGTLRFYYSNPEIVYNVGSCSFDFSTFTTLFIMLSFVYQLSSCRTIKKTYVWTEYKIMAEEQLKEQRKKSFTSLENNEAQENSETTTRGGI